jgi:hypothetical protein
MTEERSEEKLCELKCTRCLFQQCFFIADTCDGTECLCHNCWSVMEDESGQYREERRTSRRGDWIQTFTGRQYYPLDPRTEDIDIEDIAQSLSQICRFNGHSLVFYSVAQHCVLVSMVLPDELALEGLMHDSPEAYVCDIPRPLKRLLEFQSYREFEALNDAAIRARFSLQRAEPPQVKEADLRMLATEARDLMSASPVPWSSMPTPYSFIIEPWSSERARAEFLAAFKRYGGQ